MFSTSSFSYDDEANVNYLEVLEITGTNKLMGNSSWDFIAISLVSIQNQILKNWVIVLGISSLLVSFRSRIGF
jgi:hypothetical protein